MNVKYPTTSKSLLERVQTGDEISWTEFYNRYKEIIFALGRLKGLSAPECDDLVQEVMTRFFQNTRTFRFDPQIARFRTYFGRIIYGKICDKLRSRLSTGEILTPEPLPCDAPVSDSLFDAALLEEWRLAELEEAKQHLRERVSPETYLIFEACTLQGQSASACCERFRIGSNKLYKIRQRCLAILREEIAALNQNDPDLRLNCDEL